MFHNWQKQLNDPWVRSMLFLFSVIIIVLTGLFNDEITNLIISEKDNPVKYKQIHDGIVGPIVEEFVIFFTFYSLVGAKSGILLRSFKNDKSPFYFIGCLLVSTGLFATIEFIEKPIAIFAGFINHTSFSAWTVTAYIALRYNLIRDRKFLFVGLFMAIISHALFNNLWFIGVFRYLLSLASLMIIELIFLEQYLSK